MHVLFQLVWRILQVHLQPIEQHSLYYLRTKCSKRIFLRWV